MTAPNGAIIFNNATGSDTAASGLGPATALSGAGASLNATSTVDLSANTPDLSGVTAGDLLWVDTSSGRQFSIIASVNDGADTVTCDDAFAVTESGRNWGIGGKRKTIENADSRLILSQDGKSDWSVEFEDDQTVNTTITVGAAFASIQGDGTTPTILQTANAAVFTYAAAVRKFDGLKLTNSNVSKTSAYGIVRTTGGSLGFCRDMVFGDSTNKLFSAIDTGGVAFGGLFFCEIQYCTGEGLGEAEATRDKVCVGCNIHHNTGFGVEGRTGGSNSSTQLIDCLIHNNTLAGLRQSLFTPDSVVKGCHFYSNGGDGIDATGGTPNLGTIMGNTFVLNGGYGIDTASGRVLNGMIDFNAFGSGAVANTSGATNNIPAMDNEYTLTADPFA